MDNDGPPKLENFGEVPPRLLYKVGGRILEQMGGSPGGLSLIWLQTYYPADVTSRVWRAGPRGEGSSGGPLC